MSKSLSDFMKETGGDFSEAQRRFQASLKAGTSNVDTMSFSNIYERLSPVSNNTNTTTVAANIGNNVRVGHTGVHNSYNPYSGGTEAINPHIGVNEGQYNMNNKQELWEKVGNTGNFQMDAFYRGNDGSLQIKDEYRRDLKNAKNLDDINAYFNQSQIEKFENRNVKKPSAEGFARYNEAYSEILRGGQKAPTPYSAVEDIEKRRKDYGMDTLELEIAKIHKDMETLEANTRIRANYASDKAIPMGAIAGRVSTIERQGMERRDELRREANYLNDQYKTKMGVIEMFMKAGASDYERAKEIFDDNYKRNRDMLDMYIKDNEREYDREREVKKDAQATLQTLYNGVMSGSIDKDSWDTNMENQIMKLELQAGFPVGLIKSVYNKNPKADIVQQNVTDVNGKKMLNMVMMDKSTGQMYVENIEMGASSTPSDKGRYQYKDGQVFDTHTGRVNSAPMGTGDVASIIEQCRTTGQCGEGVNDYLQKIGLGRLMGDSYASKKQYITPGASPQIGGLAIWQPSGAGAKPEYGHVGIVVGVEGNNVIIHDWNWAGDRKQQRHAVPMSSILKNGGFMTISGKNTTKKTASESKKEEENTQKEMQKESQRLLGEMQKGNITQPEAHAQMYVRWGQAMIESGMTKEQVQEYFHDLLGGDITFEKYKEK